MEFVLFETPVASNMLSPAGVLTLRRPAEEQASHFTVRRRHTNSLGDCGRFLGTSSRPYRRGLLSVGLDRVGPASPQAGED